MGVNCLRSFPVYGNVIWGARTLEGADQLASEWKYLPVRRLTLFMQESLYRGTQWVVFEPNDEPLWSQIRLNVGAVKELSKVKHLEKPILSSAIVKQLRKTILILVSLISSLALHP